MCQLLETIKCENGQLANLPFHQARFDHAREVCFGVCKPIELAKSIIVPPNCQTGIFRCRIVYSRNIETVEFIAHHPRKVNSLKLIVCDNIEYAFKFADRQKLQSLFAERGNCDDIVIVKNGRLTDSFTANTIFSDGQKWWAPNSPLLNGTQRAHLLSQGQISETEIRVADLPRFEKIGLINAMWDLGGMPTLQVGEIQR